MKTIFLKWEISRSKSQFEKKIKKTAFFFFRLEAEFFLSPCYHARHLQQIHWFKIFCRIYGLAVMLTITRSSHMSLINEIINEINVVKECSLRNILKFGWTMIDVEKPVTQWYVTTLTRTKLLWHLTPSNKNNFVDTLTPNSHQIGHFYLLCRSTKFSHPFFPLTALSQILRGMVWTKIIH